MGPVTLGFVASLVGLVALLAGCLIASGPPTWYGWSSPLLVELGTSLIPAGLLIAVFETRAQDRHKQALAEARTRHAIDIAEIKDASLRTMFQADVHSDVFDEFQRQVLRSPLIRRDGEVVMHLERPAGTTEGCIWKRETFSFKLTNISATPLPHKWLITEDDVADRDDGSSAVIFEEVTVVPAANWTRPDDGESEETKEPPGFKRYTKDQLREMAKPVGKSKKQNRRIEVPIDLGGEETFFCTVRTSTLMPDSYQHAFGMGTPTKSLRLRVTHPDDVVVKADIQHPLDGWLIAPDETERRDEEWHAPGMFLPNQGFVVSWETRTKSAAADKPSSPQAVA